MTSSTPSTPPISDIAAADIERISALCRYIESHLDESLTLDHLAGQAGLSRFHLQRRFKAVTGVSPRQYIEALRLRRFKSGLRDETAPSDAITDAIFDAGFGSASRLYERTSAHLGMTPGQYRAGGKGVSVSYAFQQTELGPLLMAASDRGLCFVQFGADEPALLDQLASEFPQAVIGPMPDSSAAQFSAWMQALSAHLQGRKPAEGLPLDLRGTAFQHRVWTYLLSIPAGELRSYTEVAEGIGSPRAVRAVASACASNRVGVIVPCHRVIRGDGSLGGYRWGLALKRALIDAERRMQAEEARP